MKHEAAVSMPEQSKAGLSVLGCIVPIVQGLVQFGLKVYRDGLRGFALLLLVKGGIPGRIFRVR